MQARPAVPQANRLHLRQAVAALRAGGVIAYPTEGVWGLGCEPRDRAAVARLLSIKQRDWRKGLILIAAEFEPLRPYLARLSATKLKPVLASWPGPVTWLLPCSPQAPAWITGGREQIAVRVTAHPLAAALCRAYDGALVSTSANLSTRPPARTRLQARRQFNRLVDYVLPGEVGGLNKPTEIRELRSGRVVRR